MKLGTGVGLFDIEFQIGSLSEIAFRFVDIASVDVDISLWTFEFFVKTNAGDRIKQISKTLGSGLSFPIYESSEVDLSFTDATIAEGEYVWELRRTDVNKPLLAGTCRFSFDPKSGDTEVTTPIINETLTVQVVLGGSSTSSNAIDFGDHASTSFPTDEDYTFFRITAEVVIDGITCYPGDILVRMLSGAGNTNNWNALTGWRKL